ncbi:MAG: DUF2304 domain-containing protein, partial [Bacillota bacterium]
MPCRAEKSGAGSGIRAGLIYLLALTISLLFFLTVLELVRKGALHERYALLWLFAAAVIIGLAAWPR